MGHQLAREAERLLETILRGTVGDQPIFICVFGDHERPSWARRAVVITRHFIVIQ